jgi:peptide/nickel transport system permease protein
MRTYIIKRLLFSAIAWAGMTVIVFTLIRLIPGDAAVIVSGTETRDKDVLAAIRHELGTDKPAVTQYFVWVGNVLRGDLGKSFTTGRPTISRLRDALPVTVELALLSMVVGVTIAIPLGVLSAARAGSLADVAGRAFSVLGLSVPGFWLATLIVVLPSIWFGWSPPIRYVTLVADPRKNLELFVPAALALGWLLSASVMRMTRATLLEVLREDYIRTARAKGVGERGVVYRHALRNALIPVVTIAGLQLGALLGGSVVIESIFNLPGVGRLTLDAVRNRDYPQLQTNILFMGGLVIFVNLLVDLSYGWLDPHIRYG